jgi:rare lipoprotein A
MRKLHVVALGAALLCVPNVAEAATGVASYYGYESGRRTASGEGFNPVGMTAAHKTLKFGTMLRVTYHGRSVVVKVNDRGPFVRGRVLDLAFGAARSIGLTHAGHGTVSYETVGFQPIHRGR